MEATFVEREAFTIMGVLGHFANAGEAGGPLWDQYMEFEERVEPLSVGDGHYGVYLGADHDKPIEYLAGRIVAHSAIAPEGVETREVPAALYAVFRCSLRTLGPTYGQIWRGWLPSSPYAQDRQKLGFDYFAPGTTSDESPVEIWLPVKRTRN